MPNWNASNYRDRKAKRLLETKPEWVTNPDTGEEFFLRKVGGLMSSVLAGYMPAGLTAVAVEAWKEKAVKGLDSADMQELAESMTPEQRESGERETRTLSQIIQQACVIPFLSNEPADKVEFPQEWYSVAVMGMKEKDPRFDAEKFDPKELVFDPRDLDDKDTMFLFKWARGLTVGVSVRGGNVISTDNFSALRKKPGRSSRAGSNQPAILKSA